MVWTCRAARRTSRPSARRRAEFGVEVYRDETTGNLVFIGETGSLAVTAAAADLKAPTPKVSEPRWSHGLNVKCRTYGEKEFSERTRVFGIEVFRDENVGATIYLNELGKLSAQLWRRSDPSCPRLHAWAPGTYPRGSASRGAATHARQSLAGSAMPRQSLEHERVLARSLTQRTCDLRRQPCVRDDERMVRLERLSLGDLGQAVEQEGRQFLAAHADADRLLLGGRRAADEVLRVERDVLIDRLGKHQAGAAQGPVDPAHLGRRRRRVDAGRDRLTARVDIEGGKLVGAEADDRHALRLEDLQRARDVEDALGAGADDGHRSPPQLVEIGGDVPVVTVAMGAADAAGSEDANAGPE